MDNREDNLEKIYDEMLECMVCEVFESLESNECPHCVIKQALANAFKEGLREGRLGTLEDFGEMVDLFKADVIAEDE